MQVEQHRKTGYVNCRHGPTTRDHSLFLCMHVERHTYFAGLLGIISSDGRMKFFRHMTRTTTVKTNSRKYCRAKFHRIFAVLHQ